MAMPRPGMNIAVDDAEILDLSVKHDHSKLADRWNFQNGETCPKRLCVLILY
jgi:hypothetical protein